MDLSIFFDKVDEQLYENIKDSSAFFHQISAHTLGFPDWQKTKIALVGLLEERGNPANVGCGEAADAIRKQLYALKRNSPSIPISDLGNLRNGPSVEDTYLRLKEIVEILLDKDLFVILLGGSHDLSLGQYQAYEKSGKMVSVLTVDAIVDILPDSSQGKSVGHLHDMISHDPNYLFHLCHLGSQSFLNDPSIADIIEKLHFENVRVGQMRENFSENEPLIRQADMLSFDMSAIKRLDAPGNAQSNVFGLTAEEACQLAWYAGTSDKLSSAGIFEYNPSLDKENQTAFVIATMVWYLVEGYCQRKGDLQFDSQHFTRYMVGIKGTDEILVFHKNKRSEKWWMEVPYTSKGKEQAPALVPCSYSDYECALNGELPDRWVLMHAKLF